MCELNAYTLDEKGKEVMYLESVTTVRPDGGAVYLKNLFGEERTFQGRITEILFNKNKMILQK